MKSANCWIPPSKQYIIQRCKFTSFLHKPVSNYTTRAKHRQLSWIEYLTTNQGVGSSNLSRCTTESNDLQVNQQRLKINIKIKLLRCIVEKMVSKQLENPQPARNWVKILAQYREPQTARSIFELLVTLIPFFVLWSLAWWLLSVSPWLALSLIQI